jgi:hypothetical protein
LRPCRKLHADVTIWISDDDDDEAMPWGAPPSPSSVLPPPSDEADLIGRAVQKDKLITSVPLPPRALLSLLLQGGVR